VKPANPTPRTTKKNVILTSEKAATTSEQKMTSSKGNVTKVEVYEGKLPQVGVE
jgi:hypothetical protein